MKRYGIAVVLVLLTALLAGFAWAEPKPDEIYAENGMVSSAHRLASRAGVEILQKGGNAIDAAVATALALNVVEANASGIGGGGFMTVRFAKTGEVVVLDYREIAPASATKDLFASEQAKTEKWSQLGGKSVGVPGWLAGMMTALEKYGTMSFADVAQPAIRLAEEGFSVAPMQTQIITDELDKILAYNDPAKVAFLKDGLPYPTGETLKQPALAKTFRLIGEKGIKAFYDGPIGQAVVDAVNASGGAMTMKDLKTYTVQVRKPVEGIYRGYAIYSVPPASSGGTHIVQLLNIMENFPVKEWGHNGPRTLHFLAEAMKLMYADRSKYMADTAFANVPLEGLASKAYAKTLAEKIKADVVMQEVVPGDPFAFQEKKSAYLAGDPQERISTSHFSVVDKEGNIVASTNTVNYFFGSGVFVPEYGFVLNNEMDDFSSNPESVNAPEPGKRPLSSMSPTIVLDPQGKPFMALGSAGATRIITAVSQIIMNVVDFGMSMDLAIEQPRIANLVSGGKAAPLAVEKGISPETIRFLEWRGHKVDVKDFGGWFGTAQGILFKNGRMNGGADSRRLGVPVGY